MKKAGSRTGGKGLTLVETLLAVLILSSAILFISPAFFRSGGALAHLSHRFEAELLMNNLISQTEESLRKYHSLDQRALRGEEKSGNASYSYDLQVFPQDKSGSLYLLTIHMNWRDLKDNQISKTAYILQ